MLKFMHLFVGIFLICVCVSGVSAFEYTSTLTRDDLGVCDTYEEFLEYHSSMNSESYGARDEVAKQTYIWLLGGYGYGQYSWIETIQYNITYANGNTLNLTFYQGDMLLDKNNARVNWYDSNGEMERDSYSYIGTCFLLPSPHTVKTVRVLVDMNNYYGFFSTYYHHHLHQFNLQKDDDLSNHTLDIILRTNHDHRYFKPDDTRVRLITKFPVSEFVKSRFENHWDTPHFEDTYISKIDSWDTKTMIDGTW